MLQSQDQWYGFWGSMGDAAETAWALALPAIVTATGCEEDEVRDFLDSRYGRHFADTIENQLCKLIGIIHGERRIDDLLQFFS